VLLKKSVFLAFVWDLSDQSEIGFQIQSQKQIHKMIQYTLYG
jgi:hypothetical protein